MSKENCISGTVILGEVTCTYSAQLISLQEEWPTDARIAQVSVSPVNGDGTHPIHLPADHRTRMAVPDKTWIEHGILMTYHSKELFRSLIDSSTHHQPSTARP